MARRKQGGETSSHRTSSRKVRSRKASSRKHEAGLAFRLPSQVKPLAYRLHIDVDPSQDAGYRGEVEIDVQLSRSVKRIELHAVELTIARATLQVAGTEVPCDVEAHPARETIVLVPERQAAASQAILRVSFSGTLRCDLRGFYAASAKGRKYAFTQLEAADARRFFPCFDEPACKARFTISVTTGEANTVVSNNPVARVETPEAGRKTVHFTQTPLLSTYLVALAVGELESSEPVFADGVAIRIVHVPGSQHLTGFALDAARECLGRLTRYFGLPYPYAKLDLVAVPDFEIGAMENAGAVFFRETLLLIDEATVSLAEKKRAAEVICHELAHMWYGNLVTMRFWDDLWLNEAFATFMAFDVVAKWRPEWKMWNDFGHSRNSALHLDALDNTHPIYTEVRTPADATENFDLITYEKGAAVVRMLERYLGRATFQKGVRTYIKRHREGNTVAKDLWRALQEAAGQDVERVVRAFITQPGFPLIRIERRATKNGAELVLSQERFHARGPRARSKSIRSQRWAVPWVGRVGERRLARHLLTTQRARIEIPKGAAFIYGNADEGGFFRPLHAPSELAALVCALPKLATSERLGLLHHQWALVRAGYAELSTFLPLMAAFSGDPEPDVLHALVGPCEWLVDDLAQSAGAGVREQMQAQLARIFGPEATKLGFDAAAGESDEIRLRRTELVTLVAVVAEAEATRKAAEARCQSYLLDRRCLDANLVAPVLAIGAQQADAARLSTYLDASLSDPTPQERRRFRMALGDVRDDELVHAVLRLCLTDRIPTQDVALLLAQLLGNRQARVATWSFIKAEWPTLRERMPAMLVSRLVEATPKLRGESYRKDVASFFAANPVPSAVRALRQAQERFRLDAGFRKRAAPALRRWLSEQG